MGPRDSCVCCAVRWSSSAGAAAKAHHPVCRDGCCRPERPGESEYEYCSMALTCGLALCKIRYQL